MRALKLESDVIVGTSYYTYYSKPAQELREYTKDELMAILNKKCPDVLGKFPAPETFEIKMNRRRGVDNPTLQVGHIASKMNQEIKGVLWLEEYNSENG
jgi:hypothetical protein